MFENFGFLLKLSNIDRRNFSIFIPNRISSFDPQSLNHSVNIIPTRAERKGGRWYEPAGGGVQDGGYDWLIADTDRRKRTRAQTVLVSWRNERRLERR